MLLMDRSSICDTTGAGMSDQEVQNWLRYAFEETDRVGSRLDEFLGDSVEGLYMSLGMVPNATRRIITEIKPGTAQDRCAVLHASRFFNNTLAAFMLLRKGMLVEAITVARTALETCAQAVLFLRREDLATKWLNGTRYKPAKVRELLGRSPDFQPLYSALSEIAHANPEARWAHSVDVPPLGYAIFYGGTYRPKEASRLLTLLCDLVLVYLREFDSHYRVGPAGSCWRPSATHASVTLKCG
jgi:hypothetical protein